MVCESLSSKVAHPARIAGGRHLQVFSLAISFVFCFIGLGVLLFFFFYFWNSSCGYLL
jgi:hypothetical protein